MMKDKFGLIGFPLGHSFSKLYFTDKFEKEGIDATYSLFPLDNIEKFKELVAGDENLKGLNVTIPYKTSIIPYLDELSEEAKAIGAVNVIRVDHSCGRLYLKGFNSDYTGFMKSLKPLLHPEIKKALVLGTGGASKAAVYALSKLGIKSKLVSRSPSKDMLAYSQLDKEVLDSHLLIVNTTPLGMHPKIESYPPIPYQYLTSRHICYDLIYNPEQTEFLRKSAQMGASIKNGLQMLYLQAERSWEIWNEK